MNYDIRTARASLRSWLESLVRIDQWDADSPDRLYADGSTAELPLPAVSAIQYPVKELSFTRDGLNTITGNGVFTFSLIYRYPGELTHFELPIERVEAVAQFLYCQSLLGLSGCSGLKQVQPAFEEFPVAMTRTGDDQSDWLLHVHIVLDASFAVTELSLPPEFGPTGVDPGDIADFDQLSIKTYRASLNNLTDNVLDATINITKA